MFIAIVDAIYKDNKKAGLVAKIIYAIVILVIVVGMVSSYIHVNRNISMPRALSRIIIKINCPEITAIEFYFVENLDEVDFLKLIFLFQISSFSNHKNGTNYRSSYKRCTFFLANLSVSIFDYCLLFTIFNWFILSN